MNKKIYVLSGNKQIYEHYKSLEERGFIVWYRKNEIAKGLSVGDIIPFYQSNEKKISCILKIVERREYDGFMTEEFKEEELTYWKSKKVFEEQINNSKYILITKKIETDNFILTMENFERKRMQEGGFLVEKKFEDMIYKIIENKSLIKKNFSTVLPKINEKIQYEMDNGVSEKEARKIVKSQEWERNQKLRKEILIIWKKNSPKKNPLKCPYCGKVMWLKKDDFPYTEVHHINFLSENPKYNDNIKNLIPLCPDCHKQSHYSKKTKEIKNELLLIRNEWNK